MDRERTNLERQEKKLMADIKKDAKAGRNDSAKIMAKDLVRTRGYIKVMESATDVVRVPGCGYGLRATRDLSSGEVILREAPIVTLRMSALHEAFHTDAQLRTLAAPACSSPWADDTWWPPTVRASSDFIERFAEIEFDKVSADQQQRWMDLVDSFSTPPAKTPGNVLRSNAFTEPTSGDNLLYTRLCRANHSCAPNLSVSIPADGVAVVSMQRDARRGDALTLSYLSAANLSLPAHERRELLRTRFRFWCRCNRCCCAEVPDPTPPAVAPAAATGWTLPECQPELALAAAQAALQRHLSVCAAQLAQRRGRDDRHELATVRACAEALHATERARRALEWNLR